MGEPSRGAPDPRVIRRALERRHRQLDAASSPVPARRRQLATSSTVPSSGCTACGRPPPPDRPRVPLSGSPCRVVAALALGQPDRVHGRRQSTSKPIVGDVVEAVEALASVRGQWPGQRRAGKNSYHEPKRARTTSTSTSIDATARRRAPDTVPKQASRSTPSYVGLDVVEIDAGRRRAALSAARGRGPGCRPRAGAAQLGEGSTSAALARSIAWSISPLIRTSTLTSTRQPASAPSRGATCRRVEPTVDLVPPAAELVGDEGRGNRSLPSGCIGTPASRYDRSARARRGPVVPVAEHVGQHRHRRFLGGLG